MFLMECENRPIFLTAWSDGEGEIHYFPHPYQWDELTEMLEQLTEDYDHVVIGDVMNGTLDLKTLVREYGGEA